MVCVTRGIPLCAAHIAVQPQHDHRCLLQGELPATEAEPTGHTVRESRRAGRRRRRVPRLPGKC